MTKFLLCFDDDVSSDKLWKAVKKFNPYQIAEIPGSIIVQQRPPDIYLKERNPAEDALRRIIRDEISRL